MSSRSQWRIPVLVIVWVAMTLLLEQGATVLTQALLGLVTWTLLIGVLAGESSLVRAQTAVVVVFATAVEYTFSPWLEVYTYRLDNVPAFVPPGHGLVYLAALSLGRTDLFVRHSRTVVATVLVVGATYVLWGISPLSPRSDVLGAFWFGCLVAFLLWGRSTLLYAGAFFIVTYLELLGTSLGTWTWSTHDPTGLVSMGNPPSGAAGGYGWFDLVAVAAAPLVLRGWTTARLFVERGQQLVVQQAVRRQRVAPDEG